MSYFVLKSESRNKAYGYKDRRRGVILAENLTEEVPKNYVEEISRVNDADKAVKLLSLLWKREIDVQEYLDIFTSMSDNDKRGFEEDLLNTEHSELHNTLIDKEYVNTDYRYIPYGYTREQVESLYWLIHQDTMNSPEELKDIRKLLDTRSDDDNDFKFVDEYARRIKTMYFLDDIQDAYDIIQAAYEDTTKEG